MRWLDSLTDDSTTLQSYLQTISRFPSLSDAEESALAERVRRCDRDALARLVEAHLGLVLRHVCRYRVVGVPLLALVREGNLALIEAARHFDPTQDGRFGPYAVWWIRQSVLHRMAQFAPAGSDAEAGRHDGRVPDALRASFEYASGSTAEDELTPHDVLLLDQWWRRAPLSDLAFLDEPFDSAAVVPALDEPEEAVRRALVADLEASMRGLEPHERLALQRRLGLTGAVPGLMRGSRLRQSSARAARLSARAVRKLCGQRHLRSSLN